MATFPQTVEAASAEGAAADPRGRKNAALRSFELWHLLSLDAPSVAMLWTWFLARANHITLPATAVFAMGTAVWMLYAADRLLDSRALQLTSATPAKALVLKGAKTSFISSEVPDTQSADLEARHYFHRRHQRAFRLGILAASVALAILLPELAPQSVRLYLALGTLLFAYFVLIHIDVVSTRRLPKELAVGVFFSAATFVPTVARVPGLRLALLPGAVIFAVLCSVNCLFIYEWEHPAASPHTHPATRVALGVLPYLAIFTVIVDVTLALADRALPWQISIACAGATLLLLLLHGNRRRFAPTTLRAAADLCLLTPLLLLDS